MIDPDRVELQVAAVVGAVLGIVTGYLVGSGGWFIAVYL
jgi:F0F1-type ATP synthase assembly protein I